MLAPLILELLSIGALFWTLVILIRIPSERLPQREKLASGVAVAVLLLGAAATFNTLVLVQGPGAVSAATLGTASGLQIRAQQWLKEHEAEPPKPDEVGRNIRIITDGVAFLRPYQDQLPPHLRLQVDEASRLPTRLTRILSPAEERQYYNGARAVMEAVQSLAGRP